MQPIYISRKARRALIVDVMCLPGDVPSMVDCHGSMPHCPRVLFLLNVPHVRNSWCHMSCPNRATPPCLLEEWGADHATLCTSVLPHHQHIVFHVDLCTDITFAYELHFQHLLYLRNPFDELYNFH